MLVSACPFAYFGFSILRRNFRRATSGATATGVVVGSEKQLLRGAHRLYHCPRVEFHTPGGEKIAFLASVGLRSEPKVGRQIKVLYFPDNPQDADVAATIGSWTLALLLLLVGTCFVLGSLMFYTNVFGEA